MLRTCDGSREASGCGVEALAPVAGVAHVHELREVAVEPRRASAIQRKLCAVRADGPDRRVAAVDVCESDRLDLGCARLDRALDVGIRLANSVLLGSTTSISSSRIGSSGRGISVQSASVSSSDSTSMSASQSSRDPSASGTRLSA